MSHENPRPQDGFTLVEILISLSVFLLVLLAVYELFDSSRATYSSGQTRVDVQQNARAAVDEMVRELRMAGYFPENFASPPANPLLTNPIQVATNTGLAIYGEADGDGSSRYFLYCLNGTTLRRRRSNTATASAYTCPSGSADILAENITGFQFTYLDASNTPIPNPPTPPYQLDSQVLGAIPTFGPPPTQRGAVRTVVITLTVREDVPGQSPQIYTVTSSVKLRNL